MSSRNHVGEKRNLKQAIISSAAQLFVEQGYKGTSIKQIAKAAGCTTAALYYYFEDGKAEILQEVINGVSGLFIPLMEQVSGKNSLHEMLSELGRIMKEESPRLVNRLSWLMLEFENLDGEIREKVCNNQLLVHNLLHNEVARFVSDEQEATSIAWLVQFTYFGYAHFAAKFGIQDTHFDYNAFSELLAARISCET